MSASRWSGTAVLVLLALVSSPGRSGPPRLAPLGTLAVEPTELVVGQVADVTFTYTAGDEGLPEGSFLSVQLPGPTLFDVVIGVDRGWWSRARLGCVPGLDRGCTVAEPDPACESATPALGCVTAWVDEGVDAGVELVHERDVRLLPHPAFRNYLRLYVTGRDLAPGESARFRFHGTVQSLPGDYRLRAYEVGEDGTITRFDSLTPLTFRTESVDALHVVVPSRLGTGESFAVRVVALDRYGNAATDYTGVVDLLCDGAPCGGVVDGLPTSYRFDSGATPDFGVARLEGATFADGTAGFHRIEAIDAARGLQATSGYVRVRDEGWQERIYFGDTHFHTGTGAGRDGFGLGGDHRGQYTVSWLTPGSSGYPFQGAYAYAREVAGLDFAVASEHDGEGQLTVGLWSTMLEEIELADAPGTFAVLPGYEWTSGSWGHRVVLYRDVPDPVCCRPFASWEEGSDTPAELWQRLGEASDACGCASIVIPHVMNPNLGSRLWHDLAAPGELCPAPPTAMIDDLRQPIAEIYSQHNDRPEDPDGDGTSEFVDDPCLYELGGPDPAEELDRCERSGRSEGAESLRCAWRLGHRLGVIGSSDNHTGRPGMDDLREQFTQPGGLAAVLAPARNRAAIADAMAARHTYATSGPRIYLELAARRLGDAVEHGMGDVVTLAGCGAQRFVVRGTVGGTAPLRSVELLTLTDRDAGWSSPPLTPPLVPDADSLYSFELDTVVDGGELFYLRARQSDGELAWSSPIWVEPGPGCL